MSRQEQNSVADQVVATRERIYQQHILDAAEAVFAEHGFAKATIREIAKRSGTSVGTTYRTIGDKRDLYRAVLQQHGGNLIAESAQTAASNLDPIDVLLAGAHLTITYLCNQPNYLRILLHQSHRWSDDDYEDEAQQRMLQAGIDILSEAIGRGVERGQLRPVEPKQFARLIFAIFREQLEQWLRAEGQLGPETLVEQTQEMILRLLVADLKTITALLHGRRGKPPTLRV